MKLFRIIIVLLLCSCAFTPPQGSTPETPAALWKPKEGSAPAPAVAAPEAAAVELADIGPRLVGLGELLDLALKSNPLTRSSWANAQAAYAAVGAARGSYYPQIDIGGEAERSKRTIHFSGAGGTAASMDYKRRAPYAAVDYLLFDFGGREARIDEKKLALLVANYTHNLAVQQVVLELQRSFAQYIALRFLAESQKVGLKDAEVNLDAAENRHQAGLSTIADVLQAKTSLSRAQYALQATAGQIKAVRGSVLTAAGLRPSAPVDVAEVTMADLAVKGVDENVEDLIKHAELNNPQLAAGRARVAQAKKHVDAVRAQGYPSLGFSGRFERWYESSQTSDDYSGTLNLNFPLFTGFSYAHELRQAKREAERAEADYRFLEDQRTLAVWTDYYAYTTAAQQIKTSQDMFNSAQQSHEVALGRYKEGVGSILDLLAAQSALEDARAVRVKAYADWFISLAQLRADIGTLAEEPIDTKADLTKEQQ